MMFGYLSEISFFSFLTALKRPKVITSLNLPIKLGLSALSSSWFFSGMALLALSYIFKLLLLIVLKNLKNSKIFNIIS